MADVRKKEIIKKVLRSFSYVLSEELLQICADELKRKPRSTWVREWIKNKTLGASCTIIRELYTSDPKEYKALMRLTPDQFEDILAMISPSISSIDTVMREALPARLKLEITLAFLATGTNFRILSVMFRVSKSSISKIIPKVCEAIYSALKDYIKVSIRKLKMLLLRLYFSLFI